MPIIACGPTGFDLKMQLVENELLISDYRLNAFSKILAALGLDNGPTDLGGCYVGAAPTSPATFDYLKGIGILPLQLFGSSEATGPHTTNRKGPIALLQLN